MAKNDKVTFEENLNNLETIVKALESGEISLDDAINKFTEAMKIAKDCEERLKNAEENVNKILNSNGSLEDFSPSEDN